MNRYDFAIGVVFLLGIISALHANPVVGPKPDLRIINGAATGAYAIPYQVFLVIYTNMGYRWCSGTLLTVNYVLTSGYCLSGAQEVTVRLGVYNRSDFTEPSQVNISSKQWQIHDGFDDATHFKDLGLIKLDTPAQLNQYIQLAPFLKAADATQTYEGQTGTFSGWGLPAYYNAYTVDVLNKVSAAVISNADCGVYYDYIQYAHICTSGGGGNSFCTGDQGGPLVVNGRQVGIISGGDPVCHWDGGDWPTIFTKIGSYLEWIGGNSDYVE